MQYSPHQLARQTATIIGSIEQRNLTLFSGETEKLDAWTDDLKVGLEREIKELDRAIKECRTKGKGAATLVEKLEHQKEHGRLKQLGTKSVATCSSDKMRYSVEETL